MIPRHQLPTHSELTARSLAAGLAAMPGFVKPDAIIQQIRDQWRVRDALLVDSGTSALMLALRAVAADGRPVALPAYACYDLVTAAAGADMPIVFYDIDPRTLAPDLRSLQRALEFNPAAIVVAHLYGIPLPMRELRAIADRAGAILIEDAAQAVGARTDGSVAGSTGSLGVLSFGRGKGMTGGAGGALLSSDDAGVRVLEHARRHLGSQDSKGGAAPLLKSAVQWLLARPALYALPSAVPSLKLGETVYHEPGEPRRMPRSAVAVLQEVWTASQQAVVTRRRNAARLLAAARAANGWQPIEINASCEPGYLRLPLIGPAGCVERLDLAASRLGIIRGYPIPLHRLPAALERMIDQESAYPGAELLAERLITLPTHRLLNEPDLAKLEKWLATFETTARSRTEPGKYATA